MSVRLLVVAAMLALACCPVAAADLADETALAQRHAPVVRLVEQPEECGHGEPYRPTDVDLLFDEPTVALRGPWNPVDLVKVGPKDEDVAGLFEYHLDFPGNALNPGCGYERWDRRLREGHEPAVYSHVATDPAHPGKLALQYWLFYTFNDWNNLHEGDWEMIQLLFDADDAEEALGEDPVSVGYSQHEGAEAADWGDEKLELVDGRRPVVYPAAGSHANFFDPALYVGSSGEQGVGCDDTRGPHLQIEPKVITIPSERLQRAPPCRGSPTRAVGVSSRTRSSTGRPAPSERAMGRAGHLVGGLATARLRRADDRLFGTGATDFFCQAVESGSRALVKFLRDPGLTLLVLAVLVGSHGSGSRERRGHRLPPAPGAAPDLGPGALGRRPHVRRAPAAVPRDRHPAHPVGVIISLPASLVLGGSRPPPASTPRAREPPALVLILVAIGLTLTMLGARARPGSHRLRVDPDRRGRGRSDRSTPIAARWRSSGRCCEPSASPPAAGSC